MKVTTCTTALVASLALATVAIADTHIALGGSFPDHAPDSRALKSYAERVSADIGGSLNFDMSFGGQIVDFRSSLGGISDRLVDGGQLYPAFYLSDLPVTNTFVDMGLAASESWAHTGALIETVLLDCPACDAEYDRYGIRPLTFSGSAPFMLICRNEITSLDDFDGLSVRAVSANQGLMTAVGATPVSIVPSEVFEAMQRGQVDCAFSPLDWITAYGLADVATYIVDTPLTHDSSRIPLAMNADMWDELSSAEREAMLRHLPFLTAEATTNNIADGEEAAAFSAGKGLKFGNGGDDFVQAVAAYRAKELDRVARDGKARGVENADEIVAAYADNKAKWDEILGKIGDDRAAYEEALWTEIFSKLK